jgi:hypothetical protein
LGLGVWLWALGFRDRSIIIIIKQDSINIKNIFFSLKPNI